MKKNPSRVPGDCPSALKSDTLSPFDPVVGNGSSECVFFRFRSRDALCAVCANVSISSRRLFPEQGFVHSFRGTAWLGLLTASSCDRIAQILLQPRPKVRHVEQVPRWARFFVDQRAAVIIDCFRVPLQLFILCVRLCTVNGVAVWLGSCSGFGFHRVCLRMKI